MAQVVLSYRRAIGMNRRAWTKDVGEMAEPTESQKPMEPTEAENPHTMGCGRGPTWRGWALSILAAIILSVAATLLLGGSAAFRSDRATATGAGESGSRCCPPAATGK